VNAGLNKITRNSKDFLFCIPDPEPSESLYEKVLKALNGSEPFSYTERIHGLPERLILPKGKKEGMPLQLFVHVNPIKGKLLPYKSRIFGEHQFDEQPFGFPLDKPILNFRYDGPNMLLKEVMIYHKDEMELNITHW